MPAIISGYRSTTYVLNNPATQNPATVTQFGTINVNSTAANTPGVLGTNGFPWTLTNNGTIQSVGNLGIGVNFQAGGSISNVPVVGTAGLTGGVIIGTGNAVQITGAAGTVSNSGTISHTGAAQANGIFLGAGGTVSNTGSISASGSFSSAINLGNSGGPGRVVNGVSGSPVGLISGYGSGVLAGLGAAPSTISNYGTIKGTGSASNAMTLQSGSVTNTGLISGTTVGVAINSGVGQIINGGTIATTTGNNSNTILLSAGGFVQNAGMITNAGHGTGSFAIQIGLNAPSTIINNQTAPGSGLISAYHIAIITGTAGGPSTVTNYGTIRSTASLSNYTAILLRDGGTVTNRASGRIAGGNGVQVSNAAGIIANFGVISGTASGVGTVNSFGVLLSSAGTVGNSGTISNPTANNGNGVQVGTGGGYINNSGLISAYHDGVGFFNSGTLSLVNSGTIRSTGTSPVGVSGFNDWGVISGNGGGPMTVTNFGLIAGSQAAGGGGVLLQNGGTVINQTGATINGAGGNAIGVPGTSGPGLPITVINSGTLQNSSTTNSMVYLGHGGSVTNNAGGLIAANGNTNAVSSPLAGGIVTNSGMIFAAGANGVRLAGAVGTVVNSGTIQSNSGSACGVYVLAGGAVSNSGLIQGVNEGVHFVNQAGTIVNSGSIVSTSTGTSGRAVFLSAGGTVANYGLISGSRIPTVTNGVTGYAAPVEISNAAGLVVNFGSITTTNTANGVNLLAGGSLVNGSSTNTAATISASHTGIYVGGRLNVAYPNAPGFISNYGSISAGRNGISMVSGGTITNHGLITGEATASLSAAPPGQSRISAPSHIPGPAPSARRSIWAPAAS